MIELNKSYFDDCFNVHPLIETASLDCIFTDSPFFITRAKWDVKIDLEHLWKDYMRMIKPNGAILMFAQSPFDKILAMSNMKYYRYEWIWEKTSATGGMNSKKMPMKAHENILVFYKKLPTYNPQMTTGHKRKVSLIRHKVKEGQTELYNKFEKTSYDSTERFPRDVLKYSSDKQKSALHSTQKPLALCEYLLKTYTNEGDIVLDSFGGSGTISRACMNLNRNFINIEKEEKYFKICEERLN